jgi:hypothetical protein
MQVSEALHGVVEGRRAELADGETSMTAANDLAVARLGNSRGRVH